MTSLKAWGVLTAIMMQVWTVGLAQANLISNGSFEVATVDPGAFFIQLPAGSTAITGWTAISDVDYVGTLFQAADGIRSVDLSALASGAISQTFPTDSGVTYLLRFAMAGNPDGPPSTKTLQVTVGNVSGRQFTFDISGHTAQDMGWVEQSLTFVATGATTTLTFSSETSSLFGPEIDDVRVDVIPVDHYLTYRTSATRGEICSDESAPAHRGKSCDTEEDCGGISEGDDETGFCVSNAFAKGTHVTLADQLDPRTRLFDVKKPLRLAAPADKNGEGVSDPDTHFRGYLITLTKKRCAVESPSNAGDACTKELDCGGTSHVTDFCELQPKWVRRRGLVVENQFHSAGNPLRLDAVKPDRLLVPTSKGLAASVPAPEAGDAEHFTCYTVALSKGAPRFGEIHGVGVSDQFIDAQITEQQKFFDIKRPTRVCMASDKNFEGVFNRFAALLCYQVVSVPGQPKHQPVRGLYLTNQFGVEQANTLKEDELCVPSYVQVPVEEAAQ
jgi:choice-of-anchor C domain-containing protein